MAQRAEFDPLGELERDAWSEAWGDPALQELGRRLVSYGIGEEQAALIVEQTWLFYSYVALPTLEKRLPMGIATKAGGNRPIICLFLGFSDPGPGFGPEEFGRLHHAFTRDYAGPMTDQATIRLEPFRTSSELVRWALGALEHLEQSVRQYAAHEQLDYIGLFVDDLEAELRTIMDPEAVPRWLETPNVYFFGRKPVDLLADPLDRQLRDAITRAKFNLPAA